MKNILFLLFFVIPGALLSQTFKDLILPDALHMLQGSACILNIEATENGQRFYVVYDEEISSTTKVAGFSANSGGQTYHPTSVLAVIDFDNAGQASEHALFVLQNPSIGGGKRSFTNKTRSHIGDQEIRVTYKDLIEKYPALSKVKRIDSYNKSMPEMYYKVELKSGLWNGKIKGFESSKFELAKEGESGGEKKKKKGLIAKMMENEVGSGSGYNFEETQIADLDFEDDYNGGQDKKNFWVNFALAECATSGKVVAFNGHKQKDNDISEYLNMEAVVFNADGQIENRQEVTYDIPWQKWSFLPNYVQDKLEYLAIVSRQDTRKKKIPNANKKQLKFTSINPEGEIVFDKVVELSEDALPQIDTMLTFKRNNIALFLGSYNSKQFVKAYDGGQYSCSFDLADIEGMKRGDNKFVDYAHHNGLDYIAYRTGIGREESGYLIVVIEKGEIKSSFAINDYEDNAGGISTLEFFINDDKSDFAIITKEMVKTKHFKEAILIPSIFQIKDGTIHKRFQSYYANPKLMHASSLDSKTKAFSYDNGYYFPVKTTIESGNKNYIQNRITRIELD